MDLEKIGKFIADLRKEKNLTQEQFAEVIGATSYKTISNWERGVNFPDLDYQEKICEVLGIYLEELHAGEYNTQRRKRHKRRKIRNLIITIYATITIPLILFLCAFFIYNYDATKIYRLDTKNDIVDVIVNGLLIKTNKNKILYIGSVDIYDYEIKDTDIINLEVYNNKDLLFHGNNLSSIIIKLDEGVKTDALNIIIEIKSKDKVIYENTININLMDITNKYHELSDTPFALLPEEEIIKNLEKDGFVKDKSKETKDITILYKTIESSKSKLRVIKYIPGQQEMNYTVHDENIYQSISLNIKRGTLKVNIFLDDNNIHTVLEKYSYNYLTDELNCEHGSCSSLKEIKKLLEPYITLITCE